MAEKVSTTWHKWGNRLLLAALLIFAVTYALGLYSESAGVQSGAPAIFVAFSYAMAPVGAAIGAHLMGFVTRKFTR